MTDVVTIAANAVHARLIGADRNAKLRVSALLSYLVAGHEHTDRFKTGAWDGRASFFQFSSASFPAGFVNAVETELAAAGYRVRILRKARPAPLGPDVEAAYAAVNPFGYDPRYDYQLETVRRLETYGTMVAQIATGGGKSMIARTAVKRIMRPAIFLTTRQVLMYQMKEGFEAAGFRCGVMGDGEWSPVRGVNVAMIPTIAARLADDGLAGEKTRRLLQIFELAILEEAHEAGGNSYFEVMNALPNAHYRLSLTATPFMRPDAEANMRLMAVSGQIGIRVSEQLLIDRGILARPYFRYAEAPKHPILKRYTGYQRAYKLGIVEHPGRNGEIVAECTRAAAHGLTAMVLVNHKRHGEILKDLMRQAGLRAEFIFGEHDQAARKRALEKLGRGAIDVLIGSTILDVGVDVPAVGLVCLAGGMKAEVALRQRIGRGLREKKSGPNVCLVLDFADGENNHLRDHAKTRRGIVEATPGFAENILPPGRGFDYAGLGFTRSKAA